MDRSSTRETLAEYNGACDSQDGRSDMDLAISRMKMVTFVVVVI